MRIRSFVLLTCLLFSSEVKASISLNSDMKILCAQRHFFLKKAESVTNIPLPFVLKIKFRTPYIFDLDFQQKFDIVFGRNESRDDSLGDGANVQKPSFLFPGVFHCYTCKNEYTSFISRSILRVSMREMIKRIYERVVFYFDFFIPLLFFNLVPVTKEDGNFKFFHAPEAVSQKVKKKRRSFVFCSFPYFFTYWKKYSLCWFVYSCGPNVQRIISNLYPFACLFSFSFDILVCSYLSCCIKIPFDIVVFFFFLPFTYLSLNKECKGKEKMTGNNDAGTSNKNGNEKQLQEIIPLAINKILQLFSFSIGIFDEEEIEE